MVLADTGEDGIMSCPSCGYGANVEKAQTGTIAGAPSWPLDSSDAPETVHTPEMRSIDEVAAFLKVDPSHLIKTMIFESDEEFVAVLIRGDLEINEIKLKNFLNCTHLQLASEAKIEQITGGPQGFSGPVDLEGIRIIADPTVMDLKVAATGANAADTHLIGVVPGRDFEPGDIVDLRTARAGDPCPKCSEAMIEKRGIEVGHIFKLGTKYSEKMRCTFLDAEGKENPMIMGCYGLGVGRTVAAAIEQNHDEKGIKWPLPLAPYEVVLVMLNSDKAEVVEASEKLYAELKGAGIDILFDDRPERPGVKFNDMDLIGFPVRIVAGARGLAEGNVELSLRSGGDKTLVPLTEIVETVKNTLEEIRAQLPH
jgi:prolyl-tRNA synthetase